MTDNEEHNTSTINTPLSVIMAVSVSGAIQCRTGSGSWYGGVSSVVQQRPVPVSDDRVLQSPLDTSQPNSARDQAGRECVWSAPGHHTGHQSSPRSCQEICTKESSGHEFSWLDWVWQGKFLLKSLVAL